MSHFTLRKQIKNMIYMEGHGGYRTSFAIFIAWDLTFRIKLTNDVKNKTHWYQEYVGQ